MWFANANSIEINLSNVLQLELIALDGGDGLHYDHAVWLDGCLYTK